MTNKYLSKVLEKQAGLADFIDDVTGSKVRKNKVIMDSLAEASASGKTFTDYSAAHSRLRNRSYNARVKAGLGLAGVAGVGLYSLHKYKQNQRDKILKEYETLYKQASVVNTALNLARSSGRAANKGFNTFIGKMNTANGGKVKTFAEHLGVPTIGRAGRRFNSGSTTSQARQLLRSARQKAVDVGMNKAERKIVRRSTMVSYRNLLKNKLDAKMGLLGTGGALTGAYGLGKYHQAKKTQMNNQSQAYYY